MKHLCTQYRVRRYILSEREWYKKNEVRIKLDNIEKAVKAEHEENKKFRETMANAIKQLVK